jgi:hypothetical protein
VTNKEIIIIPCGYHIRLYLNLKNQTYINKSTCFVTNQMAFNHERFSQFFTFQMSPYMYI